MENKNKYNYQYPRILKQINKEIYSIYMYTHHGVFVPFNTKSDFYYIALSLFIMWATKNLIIIQASNDAKMSHLDYNIFIYSFRTAFETCKECCGLKAPHAG